MKRTAREWLSLLGAVVLLATGGPAVATNMFSDPPKACGTLNCNSLRIKGTVLLSSSHALPWVAQIAARQGECLRIDVTAQGTDLEAVLIAPDGSWTWRDDNRSSSDLKPLIITYAVPQYGWYTLQLSHAAGSPVNADFTLYFGRYLVNDQPNCPIIVE
jgi:hypothetical protein